MNLDQELRTVLAERAERTQAPAPNIDALMAGGLVRRRRRRQVAVAMSAVVILAILAAGLAVGQSLRDTRGADQPVDRPTLTGIPLPPGGDLSAGTYVLDRTTVPPGNAAAFDSVRISFTVPNGWEAWDLGVLSDEPDVSGPNSLGVDFWIVSSVPADPCHWERGGPPVGPTVDDLATGLANQSRRNASRPTDVTLAGYSGQHLALTVPRQIDFTGNDVFPACDQGSFVSWNPPPSSPFGRYQQGPGQVDELWILDIDGIRLVVDAAYWTNTSLPYLTEVRRIVDSIRIEHAP